MSGFGANSGFGGQPTSNAPTFGTSTTPSVFGSVGSTASSGLPFGAPMPSSSLFSSQPTASQPSLFGTTPTVFGQQSGTSGQASSAFNPSGSSVFGQNSNLTFGQSNTTTVTDPGTSPLFGGPSSTLFGRPASNDPAASQTSFSAFGQPPGYSNPTSTSASASTTSFSAFGQPPSYSNATSTNTSFSAFGQPPSYSNPTSTNTSAFGQPNLASTAATSFSQPTSSNVTSTGPFGGFSSTGNLFGKPAVQPPSLFGKKESESCAGNVKQEQQFGLFGKEKPNVFKTEPGATSADSQSTTTVKKEPQFGLFGKGQPSVIKTESQYGTEEKSALFGKSDKPTGLFGKSDKATVSTLLFGKPKVETEGLLSKKSGVEESSALKSYEEDLAGKNVSSARQLFGKPVIRDESNPTEGNMIEQGRSGATNERRLFRKAQPLGRLRRISESETVSERRTSQESEKGSRTPLQRQLSEDSTRKVSIICRQVPAKFNNQSLLKRHFQRFGYVTKVFPNVNKMQATIHFKTHEQAAKAKHSGRILGKGIPPMSIYWSSYMLPSSPTEASSSAAGNRPFARAVPGTSAGAVHGRFNRAPWKHPEDVNEELDSMAGTQDFTGHRTSTQRSATGSLERSTGSQERAQRAPSPVPSSSGDIKSEKVSLNQFHHMVARTTTERAQLLSLRDKYIRQNTKRTVNVDAKAFVGTCPDMCPERERYDREDKRQLNYYEIVPGSDNIHGKNPVVDHSRAVKEYLRSSPDQDQPLPHELRPLPVLKETMTYLLKEVANQGEEGRWGDWFDFLWNRTRGIRKDITQQQLCDRYAAELIEKCARFHIFCSERLCEEDMHSFDAKINNENLTKCLQTLKEFYVDLEKKQKIFCKNEAEFRAYTVLMNLNEGDTLREVQKLRPEVRSSIPMRFALEVYSTLSNNNYIKFFRLLKNASFANACIMHRYFPQVRIKALLSMMKGYRLGSKPAQIPVSELVRLLAFEGTNEAVQFCSHYGFDTTDGDVILDRNKYMDPDAAWLPVRSKNYIECKLLVSYGEMMNGESFPPDYKLCAPTSSFDEYDRFVSEFRDASTESDRVTQRKTKQEHDDQRPAPSIAQGEPVPGPSTVSVDVKPPVPFVAPTELVRDAAKVLFWDVIGEMVTKLSKDTMDEVKDMLEQSGESADLIMWTVVQEETSDIVREVYEEANAERIRKEAEELKLFKEKLSDELVSGILYDVLYIETQTIAKMEYREVLTELKKERTERVTAEIHIDYIEDVARSITDEIAAEVFETDVVQRLKEIEEAENAVKTLRTKRFWMIWKKYHQYVKKLKRAVREFPPSASMEPLEVQNEKLSGHANTKVINNQFLIGKSSKLSVQSPIEIMKQREANEYKCAVNDLKRTMQTVKAWQPEDVTEVIYKILQKKVKKGGIDDKSKNVHMQWKMLICLPEIASEKPRKVEEVATKLLSDWFTRKYTFGSPPEFFQHEKSKVLTLSKSSHKFDGKSSVQGWFHLDVCVRSVEGYLEEGDVDTMVENRTLLGTSGMIFVLPAPVVSLYDPKARYWSENRERLCNILNVGKTGPAISLVIVMVLDPVDFGTHDSYSSVSECLHLEDLIENKWIFDYHFVDVKFERDLYHGVQVTDPEFYKKVSEGIEWIADRSMPPPALKVSTLQDFIENVLIKMFYPPMLQNLKQRKENGYLERNPNSILELYNSVIDHARYVVTLSSHSDLSWPVPEFVMKDMCNLPAKHWNMQEYMEKIADILFSFKLPDYIISRPESDLWIDAKEDVRTYFADHVGVESPVIWGNLNSLLKQVEEDFEQKCQEYKGEAGCQPFYVHLPFSKIIPLCIEHKMETIDFRDYNMDHSKMGCVPELRVAYSPTELQDFIYPVDWRHQEAEESFKGSPSLELTLKAAANRQASERTKRKTKRTISIDMPDELNETKRVADNLLYSIKKEQSNSENFIKQMEEELARGEAELDSYGNLSQIEWKENPSSIRRKSDAGVRRRKSEEYDIADKGKRPRKRYSEIGISPRTFPRLALEEDINNLKKDVKKFKEEYAHHQERMLLDIDYNETLLSRLVRDKLQDETF